MKPKRPDSAKSRLTQQTHDTEKLLNESKFSQTYSSSQTFTIQKKDDFQEYLKQKQKDPKFKKYYKQTTLEQIPQVKPQLNKLNSKPFEKRSSRVTATSNKKIQQPTKAANGSSDSPTIIQGKWTLNQPISKKKQNKEQKKNMNSSKTSTFAEKNKQKLNSINGVLKETASKTKPSTQTKIDMKGFKVNVPGKRTVDKNGTKGAQNQFLESAAVSPSTADYRNGNFNNDNGVANSDNIQPITLLATTQHTVPSSSAQNQRKAKPKTKQQQQRQEQMLEISRFINEVQMRNIDNYPEGYEEFVEQKESRVQEQDIEKINIADFLNEPTQRDYRKIQRKIEKNQEYLNESNIREEKLAESQISIVNSQQTVTQGSSIDLDKMIDGSQQHSQMMIQQNSSEMLLSSLSSQDLKQRNLFLTEILKGRVTKDDISKLQDMERSQIKLMKLDQKQKQATDDSDMFEAVEINMMKKKSNRLMERNKIQASGHIYRDCDYLSEQNKERLERLLNGDIQNSPFQVSEWQTFAMKRLDEGIRLYRQFSTSNAQGDEQLETSEELLPKDPVLRKQTQKKLLKSKIDSVNKRLKQIQNIVVNQTKIKSLIQAHSHTKISEQSQSYIKQKGQQLDSIQQKKKKMTQMLHKAEQQKKQMQTVISSMQAQYSLFQKQTKVLQTMTNEQFREKEKQNLQNRKLQLKQIQTDMVELQKGAEVFEQFSRDIQMHMSVLRELDTLNMTNLSNLTDHNNEQTIQQLDQKFNKMAESRSNYYPSQQQEEEQKNQNQIINGLN